MNSLVLLKQLQNVRMIHRTAFTEEPSTLSLEWDIKYEEAIAELEQFKKIYLTKEYVCKDCELENTDSSDCDLCSRRYYDRYKLKKDIV